MSVKIDDSICPISKFGMMILWIRYLKYCCMNPLIINLKVIFYGPTKCETIF